MEGALQIWSCIPVSDFDVPSSPATDAARGAAMRLWQSLQNMIRQPKQATISHQSRGDRPHLHLFSWNVSDPSWDHAAIELADAVGDDWFQDPHPTRLVYPFVAPPGVKIDSALRTMAQQRRLCLIEPPPSNSLLNRSKLEPSLFDAMGKSTSEVLVMPNLERWYLRHEDGLSVLRDLLQRLSFDRRRVLLGCDSWAWAFLQHAIGIQDQMGEPQTFASFDARRLDAWLCTMLNRQRYEFLQSGNDQPVFSSLEDAEFKVTSIIASLAANARGNPGVALALWRDCLRTRDTDGDAQPPGVDAGRTTIWVDPSSRSMPDLLGHTDRLQRFILHSLLLHGGLSLASLCQVLPFSSDDILRRIGGLRLAGFIEQEDDILQVSLTGYPVVRQTLQNEGMLTDAF
jgi:hypothetical protein